MPCSSTTFRPFSASRACTSRIYTYGKSFAETGVAQPCYRHLAGIAVERGCGRFEWSVLDWNQRAIDFYKALGAVPMDEWTLYRVSGDALTNLATGR